jgi:hypothetical protein
LTQNSPFVEIGLPIVFGSRYQIGGRENQEERQKPSKKTAIETHHGTSWHFRSAEKAGTILPLNGELGNLSLRLVASSNNHVVPAQRKAQVSPCD